MIGLTYVRRRGGLVVVAVLAFVLSACAALGPGPGAPGTLQFGATTTLDGAPLDAATLAGESVVLWFWTPF